MSNFDHNAVSLDAVNSSSVKLPEKSTQAKVYLDKVTNKLMKLNFDGSIEEVGKTEINLVSSDAEVTPDGFEYKISVPNPNKLVQALELALRRLVESTQANLQNNIDNVQGVLKSYQDSQNLANGIVDSNIVEIENKISELNDLINLKVDAIEFNKQLSSLQVDLGQFVTNINASLATKATKKELESGLREVKALIPKLPEAITVVADSSNVTVEKRGSEYGISVDIPKVAKEVSRVSGVSENKVRLMIDAAIADISGGGTVTTITSTDGSIGVTAIPGGYDLAIISGGSGGTGFTPIAGNGITITPVGPNYSFAVTDYVSKTEVASISAGLDSRINSIVIPDVSGLISKTEVASISSGLDSRITVNANDIDWISSNYTNITTTSAISGNLQNQINQIIQEGTTLTSPLGTIVVSNVGPAYSADVNDYISKTQVASISAGLDSRITVNANDIDWISSNYTNISTTSAISAGLNSRIDAIVIPDVSGLISKTEVASISAGLNTRLTANENIDIIQTNNINTIFSTYANSTTVAAISAGLNTRVANLENAGYITSSALATYTLLTTTSAISAGLDTRINAKQDTLVSGLNIKTINGQSVLGSGNITISGSSGETSSGLQGRFQLDNVNTTFTITHPAIDETTEYPVATLEVDTSGSDLYIVGIHNRTATSFQVTLSSVANTSTYVLWHISTQSVGSGDLSAYTLLTTTAAISAGLDARINALPTTSAGISGIYGTASVALSENNVVINHDSISGDPIASLTIPNAGSIVYISGITEVNSSSFKVVLSDSVPSTGYKISWFRGGASPTVTNELSVDTNFVVHTFTASESYQIPDGINTLICLGGVLNGISITMPATPVNGQILKIARSKLSQSLAIVASVGHNMDANYSVSSGAYQTSVDDGPCQQFIFSSSDSTWYKIG